MLQLHLAAALQLNRRQHIHLLHQGDVFLRQHPGQGLHGVPKIEESPPLGLGLPFGGVAVPVEEDPAMGADGVPDPFCGGGGKVLPAFHLRAEILQHLGHGSV